MNSRERFLATMSFEPVDHLLYWELGYWAGALIRWQREGLPKVAGSPILTIEGDPIAGEGLPMPHPLGLQKDTDVHVCLGMDEYLRRVPLDNTISPYFEEKTLQEEESTKVVIDKLGTIKRAKKDESSMPQFLEFPVKDRKSWEKIKEERLRFNIEERLPQNWGKLVKEYKNRNYPLCLGGAHEGYFGMLRQFMGAEALFYMYKDDPKLLHEINKHMTDLWVALAERVLSEIEVDAFFFYEDMAYKAGSLISPAAFKEFMTPYYKRMIDFLKGHGIKHYILDTDGDCWKLIPLFIEAGITGLYPFEVQAGMDVIEVRKQFPNLVIVGGIDKRALAEGKEAIDQEIEPKISYLVPKSGFIPYADHLIPPNISWDNFRYYRERIRDISERLVSSSA
jgi:uroporphyrinogen-III decarboxylase